MIELRDLTFRYEGAEANALSDIQLRIPQGDFLGIIGSSGAGKSTLTYVINGVAPHHYKGDFYGRVTVNNMDTVECTIEQLASIIGSVFQDIESQLVCEVVEDEIMFGMENFGIPVNESKTRMEYAMAAAGIEGLEHRSIQSLSGGQKQKVAIAAILALKPKIILLDEPTGELDPQASRKIFETLKSLNEEHGITIVIVEQKILLLCEFAKRLAVMDKGRLVIQGDKVDVLGQINVLEQIGVNVPRYATLSKLLREKGVYKGKTPLDATEAKAMMDGVLRCVII